MEDKKVQSLCETLGDIIRIATNEGYDFNSERNTINELINWAEEYEKYHKHIEWTIGNNYFDYLQSISYYTIFKMNQKETDEGRSNTLRLCWYEALKTQLCLPTNRTH